MSRTPVIPVGCWPAMMRAEIAAGYVGERSVEAFLRKVGKVYPRPRNISGRGRVWMKADLDRALGIITTAEGATVKDLASLL